MSLSMYLSENHKGRPGKTKYVKGYKVGKLEIVGVHGERSKDKVFYCKCDCGGSAEMNYDQLRKREAEMFHRWVQGLQAKESA